MEQNWKNGRFFLPLKFISFHESGKAGCLLCDFVYASHAFERSKEN